jgi:hypothetical protein
MLNELYQLQDALKRAGISTASRSSRWCPYPNTKTIIEVTLNGDGDLAEARLASREGKQRFRYDKNNYIWPSFNVNSFFDATTGSIAAAKKILASGDSADDKKAALRKLLKEKAWPTKDNELLKRRLERVGGELLAVIGDVPPEHQSLEKLVQRLNRMVPNRLHTALTDWAINEMITADPKTQRILLSCLMGKERKRGLCIMPDVPLHLPQVHSDETQAWINERLLASESSDTNGGRDYFGEPLTGDESKPYKKTDIPAVGPVKLRAMSRNNPCNRRYNFIDSNGWVTSTLVQQRMIDALAWITDPEREGRTWERLPQPRSLLMVYPTDLSVDISDAAYIFGGTTDVKDKDDDEDVDTEGTVEKMSRAFIQSLRGIETLNPDLCLNVIALAKVGKQSTKVIISRSLTIPVVEQAAEDWLTALWNRPEIRASKVDHNLLPSDMVRLTSLEWRQDLKTTEVPGVSAAQSMSIFLGEDNVNHVLRVFVKRSANLFAGYSPRLNKKIKRQVERAVTLLGVLLHKQGIQKEAYMQSTAFLLGQFLQLQDSLHEQYCKIQRKGDIPPKLVGGSAFNRAMTRPNQALRFLAKRTQPYESWAKTYNEGNGVALVKWLLGKIGDASRQLNEAGVPERFSIADQAQLYLGYLAKINGKKSEAEVSEEAALAAVGAE